MAENKKSFLLYADQIYTIEQLPDDVAGRLYKHMLKYVNDLDPKTDELIVAVTFEPIKQQLKRDLEKWDKIKVSRSENGKLGGRPKKLNKAKKANGLLKKQTKAKKAVSVNVNVNVINNKKYIKKNFNFFKILERLGVDKQVSADWKVTRKAKKASNTKTALKAIIREAKKAGVPLVEAVTISSGNGWAGFKASYLNGYNQQQTTFEQPKKIADKNFNEEF